MILNFSVLVSNRNYRLLYAGQLVSILGSMITMVALPYQVYQLTHSSFAVGMMGVAELLPLLFTALLGGVLADTLDRKRLLIYSEIGMALGILVLAANAFLASPRVWVLYLMAAWVSGLNGFHRPSLESLTQRIVKKEELAAIGSLTMLKSLVGTVLGPSIAGLLISQFGIGFTFGIDFLTYGVSLVGLLWLRLESFEVARTESPLQGILDGLRYAWGRPELIGSYVVDFVAMIFGMPVALFPAVSDQFGGAKAVGILYAAPSIGSLLATLLSGWTEKVESLGRGICIAAFFWGIGIIAFGFSQSLFLAVFFLMFAGASDALSAVFRMSLWNRTIPNQMRGRLAGVEMIGYMSGPLLGNAESGLVASQTSTNVAIISGGVLCLVGVIACAWGLPRFWSYRLALLR